MSKREIIRTLEYIGYVNKFINEWSYGSSYISFLKIKKENYLRLGYTVIGSSRYNSDPIPLKCVSPELLYNDILSKYPGLSGKIRSYKLGKIIK